MKLSTCNHTQNMIKATPTKNDAPPLYLTQIKRHATGTVDTDYSIYRPYKCSVRAAYKVGLEHTDLLLQQLPFSHCFYAVLFRRAALYRNRSVENRPPLHDNNCS